MVNKLRINKNQTRNENKYFLIISLFSKSMTWWLEKQFISQFVHDMLCCKNTIPPRLSQQEKLCILSCKCDIQTVK